jgi:hypothetical protein
MSNDMTEQVRGCKGRIQMRGIHIARDFREQLNIVTPHDSH